MGDPMSLKQMFQNMIPDGAGVIEGSVTSENPLNITLANDSKMVLSENSVILPEWLSDIKKKADLVLGSGSIIKPEGMTDIQIKGATLTIENHLKIGDVVLLLSFNGGKKYCILDRRCKNGT